MYSTVYVVVVVIIVVVVRRKCQIKYMPDCKIAIVVLFALFKVALLKKAKDTEHALLECKSGNCIIARELKRQVQSASCRLKGKE